MARNKITNPKTIKKLSSVLNKEVVAALTRGGTGHRVDCGCKDGTAYHVWPDGTYTSFTDCIYVPGKGFLLGYIKG